MYDNSNFRSTWNYTKMKYENIFYFYRINAIGGIETFFYYLAKKYKNMVVFYEVGDPLQIKRLSKLCGVHKYNGETIECKRAFFNFNLNIIDNVKAEEYIQIAHGDYKAMKIQPNLHPKLTHFIGISKQVCRTYEEVTGHKTELIYNPIIIDKPQKKLTLISATRLTNEKGKNRMIKLAQMLDEAGVNYKWYIYTDDKNAINNPNIIYCTPKLNIIDEIADADYLVQLSDNEGYCYSVIEALCVGVPVIVTECPVFKELGVINGENGYILDFAMKNVPIDKITKEIPKFKYDPKKDGWSKYLREKGSYDPDELIKVRAKHTFDDQLEDGTWKRRARSQGVYKERRARASYLECLGVIEIVRD